MPRPRKDGTVTPVIGYKAGMPYVPSYETRQTVARMTAHNFNIETILSYIINPVTEAPINKETYLRVFADEIRTARADRVDAATSMIFDKAMAGDLQAARTIVNLQGRGLFAKKFELDTSKPIQDQINQVLAAGSQGLINAEDVGHYCAAIKLKSESMLDKLIALIKPLVGEDALSDIMGSHNPNAS